MKEEKVWFENSKGQKLAGLLYTPNHYAATVIFVNGIATDVKRLHKKKRIGFLINEFTSNGYRILIFDYYGRGESEGKWDGMNLTSALDDLEAACDFLKTDKIALIGESFGGGVSLVLASKDARVKAVALFYAAHDMDKWCKGARLKDAEKKGYSADWDNPKRIYPLSLFTDFRSHQVIKQVPKIKIPILITHGDADKYILLDQSEDIFAAANEPKKLLVFPGEEHIYTNAGFEKAFKETLTWFNKYLK